MTTASDNASYLRVRFAARLLSARPESVLDVGAGGGHLLATLRSAGIAGTGCEASEERVRALVADGFEALEAEAADLPFEDGAFDWVAMRHVPHHLPDPVAGLREALRVARRGLLVAEPWYDVELPSQRAALAAERWFKARDRAAGMVHGENLSAAELMAAVGADAEAANALDCEVTHLVRLRRRSTEDLVLSATPHLVELGPDDPAREEWNSVLEQVAECGLSWNGSVAVALEKSSA
jgi:SAM-dependent methyltransferase